MAMIATSSVGLQNLSSKTDPTVKSINDVFKQLGSGLKTGQGFESAALIAIADRFTSQIQGANLARSQINDGISLTQIADAALSEVETGMQRIQELATQSANASLNDSDRQALQKEVDAIQGGIQSILTDTSFNDINLLTTDQTLSFQTGPGSDNQTQLQLRDLSAVFTPVDVTTREGAENALSAASDALKRISEQRSAMGTAESQLVSVADTLSQLSETLSFSHGSMLNADMAEGASNAIALSLRTQATLALQTQADKLSSSRVQQLLQ
ncbi:MAG: hypothetical protein HQL84_14860 [Magnetococcales bacterium]|nr:hypothetical protein [Magnetococcales bacterium]MBF0151299.1 hypothetical protein [Magnetococcales bacterium]MBF0172031.1 hypothetical protein [Magnetococcales bacterium]MBF0346145.1 hypothetical protein [Magnetococcales bacterium]MBF0630363.1 hypothetical protein [Magnetococcales bacterium]